jgi:hypothetical protein
MSAPILSRDELRDIAGRASTIGERLAGGYVAEEPTDPAARKIAQDRLAAWRQSAAAGNADLFAKRLGQHGLDVRCSHYMAERIPGAKYIELPSGDHLPWHADADIVVDEVAEFLTGVRPVHDPDRVLATVLFTDIVGATAKAASLGDRRWRELPPSTLAGGCIIYDNLIGLGGRRCLPDVECCHTSASPALQPWHLGARLASPPCPRP